jgi:hypothetical protein
MSTLDKIYNNVATLPESKQEQLLQMILLFKANNDYHPDDFSDLDFLANESLRKIWDNDLDARWDNV